MLNKSGDNGHPSLIPDFRGNGFIFFPIEYDVSYRFIISIVFIMFRYIPDILISSDLLSWKDVKFYQRLFCIYCDDQVCFVFASVNMLYYI
jgi:hypothetical protein